jgi:predicted nucleic acid-binding protein
VAGLIVDASVAVKWFIAEDRSAAAREVLDASDELLAPDIVCLEVFNALWVATRIGRLPATRLEALAAAIPRPFTSLAPLTSLYPTAAELARRLRHPVYDATYLALALREGGTLITADELMHAAARRARIKTRML